VEVNGEPVLCKGANWIPDDAFVTRVSRAQYRERLEQARATNMNMMRVWGGGLYETEAFYELCDEMGMLVWQDFLFACAFYPEEPPLRKQIEEEARYNVTRLSPHPSLVLWNGNNENIWFETRRETLDNDDWRAVDPEHPWGLGYYLDTLPEVVEELDPSRPYWPGSPYSGSMELPPNDDDHGCAHVWEGWFGDGYECYWDHAPRFASEFGHQASPAYATLRRALPPDQFDPNAPGLRHHQKSPTGHRQLKKLLAKHFPVPEAFEDWHFLTQLNQARALQTGVEWLRSRYPVCMGTLYWQLNDCWPVLSWSAIDGDGRYKLLWYATRRFYAGRLLTLQPAEQGTDGPPALYALNDTDEPWTEDITLARHGFDGTERASRSLALDVATRGGENVHVLGDDFRPDRSDEELIAATAGEKRACWFFERDKHLRYPTPDFEAELSRDGRAHRLTVTARTLLCDVCLLADHLDPEATVSEQLVTLLPGESFTFVVRSEKDLEVDALTSWPVLQCANRFGAEHEKATSAEACARG
jgi:beta-mannosidase